VSHSCTSGLLEITEDVCTAAEAAMMTIQLLLDFSKAFDSMRHDLLLPKILHRQMFWTGLEATWMVGCKTWDLAEKILLGKLLHWLGSKDALSFLSLLMICQPV
jgi:hypothetical protein